MNIVFMGTPDFAVESLKALYEAHHHIQAVVSQPDKPTGRGMKLTPTATKAFALEKGIKVYQPEKIKNNIEFIEELKSLKPDLIVVVAYGKLLPERILELPKYGCINVHGSLLPKYRGAAPIQWSIINGEKETGVTTMYMSKGMDEGDMLLKEVVKIHDDDTYGTLYDKLKVVGGSLIVKTLEELENGNLKAEKQSDNFTIAPMIFKEKCKIDWSQNAINIKNLVRGVNPMPVAWTTLDGKIFKIWNCDVVLKQDAKDYGTEVINYFEKSQMCMVPGSILVANSKIGLIVQTGENLICIKEIQAPNAKRMNILDYLRGNHIEAGSVFE